MTLPHHSLSSDCYIISFQLSLFKPVPPREKPRYDFDFSKANFSGLCDFLHDIDFSISDNEVFNKSMCADNIGPKILKHCALAIYHHLFNLSLSQQVIPTEWKCHVISPTHKSGNWSLVTNYRPMILLICCVSKVLESIIFNHISDFVVGNISVFQFGFVKHRSSVQQLLLSFNNILFHLINSHVDMIFIDFKKLSIVFHIMSCWSNFGTLASQVTCGTGLELTLLTGNNMSL